MARAEEDFWDVLHERWRAEDPEQEKSAVYSVLQHLARRIPGPEGRHIEGQLPADIREMWPVPEPLPVMGEHRQVEKLDLRGFVSTVTEDARLADRVQAENATRAVFHALGRFLSDEERRHVSSQLPPDLRSAWDQETIH